MKNTRAVLHTLLAGAVLGHALPALCQSHEAREGGDPPAGAVAFQPYTLRTFDGKEYPAEVGRMAVPEDRARPAGRRIALGFVRLRSTSATPEDPVVFLMGGPGIPASVIARVPVYDALFQRLRERSDVLLLDQRGLGLSSPVLECPPGARLPGEVFASRRVLVRELTRRTAACAASWRARGTDPAAFTTVASADDVDDLRRALGAPRIRIVAFSYGTRLALAVVQRHGDHVGRVVLAGTNGPDNSLKLPSTLDHKLEQLGRLVARDPALGPAVPDLRGLLREQLARLAHAPLRLQLPDTAAGAPTVTVGPDGLRTIVNLHLDDPGMPAMLLALSRGDHAPLARMAAKDYAGLGNTATGLMARAINCASDRSERRWRRIRREAPGAVLGNPIDNEFLSEEFCRSVGRRAWAPEFPEPVRSSVPALFITGTLDSNTPPSNAEEVRRGFPNGVHLLVENGGHETLPIADVQAAVADFLAGRDVSGRRLGTVPPRFTGPGRN